MVNEENENQSVFRFVSVLQFVLGKIFDFLFAWLLYATE